MALTTPTSMPTWPARWSAAADCPLTYVEAPSDVTDPLAATSTGLWQDYFVAPFDSKTLTCHPPPGPTNFQFEYRATAPSQCPQGWTQADGVSTPTSSDGRSASWECCSSGWTYTTVTESESSMAVCQSFVSTRTRVLAYRTEAVTPMSVLDDESSPSLSFTTSTYSAVLSSLTATALPITVVYYYPSTAPTPTSTSTIAGLSPSAKAGIGLSAGVLGGAFLAFFFMFITFLRRRRRRRKLRKYSDVPTTAAIAGSKVNTIMVEQVDLGRRDTVRSTTATIGFGSRDEEEVIVEVPNIDSFYSPWRGAVETTAAVDATLPVMPVPPPPPPPAPSLQAPLSQAPVSQSTTPPRLPIYYPLYSPISYPPIARKGSEGLEISPLDDPNGGNRAVPDARVLPPAPSLRNWPRGDAMYVRRI